MTYKNLTQVIQKSSLPYLLIFLCCFNLNAMDLLDNSLSKVSVPSVRNISFEEHDLGEGHFQESVEGKRDESDRVFEMSVTSENNAFASTNLPNFEDGGRTIRGGGGSTNPMEVIKAIVALGERAWDLVVMGKPIVRSNHVPIAVLPQIEGRDIIPMDLERWSLPKSKTFSFSAKGRTGKELVKFDYAVHFTHSGQFNGKGKFLAAVNITPLKIKVKWGQKFNSHTELLEVVNHGTKENPIVSALMKITYTITSMTKTTQASEMYHIVGDGRVIPLQ
ncbi:MAG: hypothetical protein CME68_09500 [Halobacteriovoraceae bacterium]|nr:hypothetical protein [Halobacteriovoraceae bacterium]